MTELAALVTITARIIAGIPNPRDNKLKIPQICIVVIDASMRKSWGAGWPAGTTTMVGICLAICGI